MQVLLKKNWLLFLLCLLPSFLLIFFGNSPVISTLVGSGFFYLLNFVFGYFILSLVFKPFKPRSSLFHFERQLAFQIFGISMLGVWAFFSYCLGTLLYGAILFVFSIALISVYRKQNESTTDRDMGCLTSPIVVPVYVVLISLGYTFICLILPFASFSRYSLVREMYSDGFQRFGVIYGLASSVPPINIFLAGNDLSYYWFSLMPAAFLCSLFNIDVFTAWKVVETHFTFLSIIGIWYLINQTFKSRLIATLTILFGFIFSSYEIFAGEQFNQFYSTVAGKGLGSIRSIFALLSEKDPDHIIGVLTTYSDQLFIEDYLYVPQNAFAIFLLIILLFTISNQYWIFSAVVVSTIIGVNAFLFLPAFSAFLIVMLSCLPLGTFATLLGSAICLSVLFLSVCNILNLPALYVFLPTALLFYLSLKVNYQTSEPKINLRFVSAVLLFLFITTAVILKRDLFLIYFLNYGCSFIISFLVLIYLSLRRVDKYLKMPLLFILSYLLAHLLFTVFSVWLVSTSHLGALAVLLESVSSKLSPFNYYHKAGKGLRLFFAILSSVGVFLVLCRLQNQFSFFLTKKMKIFISLIVLFVLMPAALTGFIRANTYSQESPVSEARAADFLDRQGVGIGSVILLEDYRNSKLPQLLPVSIYYFSSWTGAVNGISHLSGTWSEQYVNGTAKLVAQERENELAELFKENLNYERFKTFVSNKRIDFFLSHNSYNLGNCAKEVFNSDGLHLYEISVECRLR